MNRRLLFHFCNATDRVGPANSRTATPFLAQTNPYPQLVLAFVDKAFGSELVEDVDACSMTEWTVGST